MAKARELRERLAKGVAELDIEVDEKRQHAMLAYLELLKRWNRVYNLTAIKSDSELLTHHVLDSLSVVPYLHGQRIIDIGSGAGLPGIPVALACPQLQVTLLDSNAKRCRFLRQVKAQLKLHNVSIVQQRAEAYKSDEKFDSLVSRAFSRLMSFIASSQHLLADGGQLIAMKGEWPEDDSTVLPEGFMIANVIKLTVPGLSETRHLIVVKKVTVRNG
jgi:16S rRNA (guanine527-N7)-methyltransferase